MTLIHKEQWDVFSGAVRITIHRTPEVIEDVCDRMLSRMRMSYGVEYILSSTFAQRRRSLR